MRLMSEDNKLKPNLVTIKDIYISVTMAYRARLVTYKNTRKNSLKKISSVSFKETRRRQSFIASSKKNKELTLWQL